MLLDLGSRPMPAVLGVQTLSLLRPGGRESRSTWSGPRRLSANKHSKTYGQPLL